MSIDKLILNSCGWVYLRSTDIDNVYKVGKTNSNPTVRAGTDKSVIIRINKSINNHEMETYLKMKFKEKYKIHKGTEYFIAKLIDIMRDYDKYFSEFENMLLKEIDEYNDNLEDNIEKSEKHLTSKFPCLDLFNTYECPNCNKKFIDQKTLSVHVKNECNTLIKLKKTDFGTNLKLYLEFTNAPSFAPLEKRYHEYQNYEKIYNYPTQFILDVFRENYIYNIPAQQRSIWMLDKFKDKYLIKHNNEWVEDRGAILCGLFCEPISFQINYVIADIGAIEVFIIKNEIKKDSDFDNFEFDSEEEHLIYKQILKDINIISDILSNMHTYLGNPKKILSIIRNLHSEIDYKTGNVPLILN